MLRIPDAQPGTTHNLSPQALVASDVESLSQPLRELLLRHGLDCPTHGIVPTALAAERASRLLPEVIVFVLRPDSPGDLAVLQQLASTVPAHVMVVGPTGDSQLILRTLHVGAHDYLDERQLEKEMPEALARRRTRAEYWAQEHAVNDANASARGGPGAEPAGIGRVVAVLGNGGGCGASTVAVNVASVLAKQPGGAGLVDLRLAAGDLAALLDLRPQYTLADLCEHLTRLDQTMFGQLLTRHASGVQLLAAPHRFDEVAKVSTKGVRQAVLLARRRFRHVVLDMENAFAAEQIESLWQADAVLMVLRLDYTSLRGARRTLQHLQDVGLGWDRVRLVVNRYGEKQQVAVAEAEKALGMKMAHLVPYDPSGVHAASNDGVPVVTKLPTAKVSRVLADVAAGVSQCPIVSPPPSGKTEWRFAPGSTALASVF